MVKQDIGFVIRKDIDFGRLSKKVRQGIVKVDFNFWVKYIDLRLKFEQMHSILLRKLPQKVKDELYETNQHTHNSDKR